MKILITGSSGQIGTNLAETLLSDGHTPVGLDIRPNTWVDSFETVLMDLSAPERGALARLTRRGFDCIVHLAAHAKVYALVENPAKALENVDMLFNALEMSRADDVPFVFGSSREVYGDIMRATTQESHADFVVAESPYSASKIAGEAFIYSYGRCYGLPHLVFRFSNVYGRYDNDLDWLERVVPLFIKLISEDRPVTVYGPEKILDFTYVDDCVAGIASGVKKLVAGEVPNDTFNLACGRGYTLEALVAIIAKALDKSPDVTFEPTRSGEVTRYVADISKARKLLGYEPKTMLDEGVPREIEWARRRTTS